MNENILSTLKAEDVQLMKLGITLGQNQTFALIAGRCSAAQAQIVRSLREDKLYKRCCEKWDEFCPKYLNVSRGEADRIIRLLDEFGPVYFEVSQLTRISAGTFRAIAPAITDGTLHHNGEAIALIPENSQKVAAAVAEMRSALPRAKEVPEEPDTLKRVETAAQRCAEGLAEPEKISRDNNFGIVRVQIRAELHRLNDQILRLAA
jgi:hypothetical protein